MLLAFQVTILSFSLEVVWLGGAWLGGAWLEGSGELHGEVTKKIHNCRVLEGV